MQSDPYERAQGWGYRISDAAVASGRGAPTLPTAPADLPFCISGAWIREAGETHPKTSKVGSLGSTYAQ